MGAAERIKEYLDFIRVSKYKFCKDLGFSPKFLDNTSNIGTDKAGKILHHYPDINPEWLLTGKGFMLRVQTDPIALKARIIQFADEYYVSRAQFFSELGITEADFMNEATEVDSTILSKLAQMNNMIDRDWLLTGQGSIMKYPDNVDIVNEVKDLDKGYESKASNDSDVLRAKLAGLERENELLREMVDLLKQSRDNRGEMGGDIKQVG